MKPKNDEKKRAIAKATLALVAQSGLSGLTMADIARAASIATSTLYVYYPRHEIVKALPIALLAACILGSRRETATLIRTKVLPQNAATRDAAFTLCWDALKA